MSPSAKCACGGRIDPATDGNGAVVDRCTRCGAKPGQGQPSSAAVNAGVGRPCSTEGCPGKLGADGKCACCLRREKWVEQHTPKRECGICGGGIAGKWKRKFCEPCAKLHTKFGKTVAA